MLELLAVSSFYGSTPIIVGMSFQVADGEVFAVLGRNGVGKTTLARTIMGFTSRSTGVIRIKGVDASSMPSHERARAGVGYVPQGRGLLPKMTVEENITLGTFARKDGQRKIPAEVLQLFPYLADNLNQRAGTLSGGQLQQLAVARALAMQPQLLILDEPTEGIQPNIAEQIQETIRTLNEKMGITILLIEQHIQFAKSIADHFVIMDKGNIVEQGDSAQLTNQLLHRHLTILGSDNTSKEESGL
jgi:urea transport system ATP-binding protein